MKNFSVVSLQTISLFFFFFNAEGGEQWKSPSNGPAMTLLVFFAKTNLKEGHLAFYKSQWNGRE